MKICAPSGWISKILYYLCNVKEAFGKWILDIAKYLATAVILSSVFSGITEKWALMIIGGLSVVILLVLGLFLINKKK
ncbi:hypothetical protein FACS1894121_0570 [Bacteroidia bacterium]|nr:hypothetical protein FACS1894121_0570 [Bacteroidia bacterium]